MATLVNTQEGWTGEAFTTEIGQVFSKELSTGKRQFTVLFDAGDATPFDAVNAAGVPALKDVYPQDPTLFCVRKFSQPLGPLLFDVFCEYAGSGNPITDPYERSWGGITNTEQIDRDYKGDAIVNTVGEKYVGLTSDVGDLVYNVTRNEIAYPDVWARVYQNTVNDAPYLGWDTGEARLLPITGQRIVDTFGYYWKITYQIQFRRGGFGWQLRILNEGLLYWTGRTYTIGSLAGTKQISKILDANGNPVTTPQRLALDGMILQPADPDVWLQKDIYTPKNYTALGLI